MLQVAQCALLFVKGIGIVAADADGRGLVKSRSVTPQVVTAASIAGTSNGGNLDKLEFKWVQTQVTRLVEKSPVQTEKLCDYSHAHGEYKRPDLKQKSANKQRQTIQAQETRSPTNIVQK